MKCSLCPRRCNSERTDFLNHGGYCKAPLLPKIARAALHYWEEPCISSENGSGTVFFSGCSLSCVYCQNAEISRNLKGDTVTFDRLAEIFRELELSGAENINLVTPTHYVTAIKKALEIYRPNIPIVYNSSGYDSIDSLRLLSDYIDIYLLDFKYFSSERAKKYSFAENYPEIAKSVLNYAYSLRDKCVFDGEKLKSGVIVRHLLLPQGTNDAIKIFDYVKENTPNVIFSIMSQYMPCGNLKEYPEINRKITAREYDKVLSHIIESGFENCYIQERNSSSEAFVPSFDLTGVKKSQP